VPAICIYLQDEALTPMVAGDEEGLASSPCPVKLMYLELKNPTRSAADKNGFSTQAHGLAFSLRNRSDIWENHPINHGQQVGPFGATGPMFRSPRGPCTRTLGWSPGLHGYTKIPENLLHPTIRAVWYWVRLGSTSLRFA